MTLPYLDKNTLYEEIVHDKKRNRALAKASVALQLKAIYDVSNLIQRFGAAVDNYMHIIFKVQATS